MYQIADNNAEKERLRTHQVIAVMETPEISRFLFCIITNTTNQPIPIGEYGLRGLTAMVKYDDHAITWYAHAYSY